MSILITGAAGRIGRTLSAGLADRFVLRRTDIVAADGVMQCDLACDDLTPLVDGAEAIIHLAGHPNSRDWEVLERANLRSSRRLLDAAVAASVPRFVFASSIHVAGLFPSDTSLADELPYAPDSPYGASKAMVEMMLRYAAGRYDLAVCALRVCSFRPAPGNARELTTWLSPGDCVRLFEAALVAPFEGFVTAWGTSANRRLGKPSQAWARLGYRPHDDAEHFAAQLADMGIDIASKSEWPLLGGAFAAADG